MGSTGHPLNIHYIMVLFLTTVSGSGSDDLNVIHSQLSFIHKIITGQNPGEGCDINIASLESLSSEITEHTVTISHENQKIVTKCSIPTQNQSKVKSDEEYVATKLETVEQNKVISSVRKHQSCVNDLNIIVALTRVESKIIEKSVSNWLLSKPPNTLSTHHFLFITSDVNVSETLLLSPNIGLKLKHKVNLSQNGTQETSCLYCDNGRPKILKIPTHFNFDIDTVHLNGACIRFSSPKIAPRFTLKKLDNGEYKLVRGLYKYFIMDAIVPRFNITYSIVLSEKGAVGDLDPKRGFVGVMGDVMHGTVDVGLCVGFTGSRYMYVDYGSVIEAEYLTFSSGKRAPYISWKAILWTLKPFMWVCTLVAFLLSVFVLYFLSKFSICTEMEDNFTGLWVSVNYIVAAFFDQAASKNPISSPVRLFCVSWLFYCLVVSNAFREKLFGFLGFPLEIHLPQSFDELAHSKFKIGLQFYGGAAYNYIKTSTTPSFVKISERMELETDPIRCFTKSLESDFSCIHYHGAAEFVKARNLSDRFGRSNIMMAPASTLLLPVSLVMKKGNLLMEKMNQLIRPVRDMGLVEEWKRMDFNLLLRKRVKWEMDTGRFKESTNPDDMEHVRAIGMGQLLGPFGILMVGCIGAAVMFVFVDSREKLGGLVVRTFGMNGRVVLVLLAYYRLKGGLRGG